MKKFPKFIPSITTITLTNLLPIIFSYFYGVANSGYYSITDIFSQQTLIAVFLNPLSITGYYFLYKVISSKKESIKNRP
jgi:hypothetical protein